MISSDEYLAQCQAVRVEYTARYPEAPAAALASEVVMLRDEITNLKATAEKQYTAWTSRKADDGIIGLCQDLSDEMKWWAENPARNDEDREEILNTIKHLRKKIETVELIEADPDDGADYLYESQREHGLEATA